MTVEGERAMIQADLLGEIREAIHVLRDRVEGLAILIAAHMRSSWPYGSEARMVATEMLKTAAPTLYESLGITLTHEK